MMYLTELYLSQAIKREQGGGFPFGHFKFEMPVEQVYSTGN